MEDCLLPPLWELAASYLDAAERWFYRDCSFLRISSKAPPDYPQILEAAVVGDHRHMLTRLEIVSPLTVPYSIRTQIFVLDRLEFYLWDRQNTNLNNYRNAEPDSGFHIAFALYPSGFYAARMGASRILLWELQGGSVRFDEPLVMELVQNGRLDTLRMLKQHGYSFSWTYMDVAGVVKTGDVEMVRWLGEVRGDWSADLANGAAFAGYNARFHVKTVEMLKCVVEVFQIALFRPSLLRDFMWHVLEHSEATVGMVEYLMGLPQLPEINMYDAMCMACGRPNTSPAKAEYLAGRGAALPPRDIRPAPAVEAWLVSRGW